MARVIAIHHRTTHTISETINGVDHEFPVTYQPQDSGITLQISTNGKRAIVGYLSRDECAENPRNEFDHVGTMVCFHSRYNLGDDHPRDPPEEWLKSLALQADPNLEDRLDRLWERKYRSMHWSNPAIKEFTATEQKWISAIVEKDFEMLPLYLYDHSGLTISTSSFSCRWDSGQLGWIYISREQMLSAWGDKSQRLTEQVREKARKCLKAEVTEYDLYLQGEVYGICIDRLVNVSDDPDLPKWESDTTRRLMGYNGDGSAIHTSSADDTCWGFYGDEYAEEEMKREFKDAVASWLNSPPEPEPEYQLAA